MHYLTAEGLSKSHGVKPLFEGLTFHVEEGDKIALVARNGTGKSTLMRILAGRDTVDGGKLWIHKDVNVVFLEQETRFIEEATVLENVFHHEHPVLDAIRDFEAAEELGDPGVLGRAIERMDELGAWDFDAKVKQILGKLGVHRLQQTMDTLSGGQRKRVALARTLIDIGFEPGHVLLMMDEPTNHLDVEMVEWLESHLNRERVTLLLVTHDRYFLDAVCDEIWELEGGELHVHKGDYAAFLERKAARMENQAASIEKARNLYRRELDWMRRQPQARTTKSKSRQDRFYDVEDRARQRVEERDMELQVKMTRLGGKVVELKKVYKSFGEKAILKGFDYTFKKGERVGIIGKNGTGKTTFLDILLGQESVDSGKVNVGETVVFGYFSQEGLRIKEDLRVIEYVKGIAESFPLEGGGSLSASQFLERFLFTPEQQYTPVGRLSGGERKRLQLLSVLFGNPNFLILDEPTNDLDLPTLGVLEGFLEDFQGCLVIVSHDRYFMDRLVDHLLVFEGEGRVSDFPGNYARYRESKAASEKQPQEPRATPSPKAVDVVAPKPQATRKKMGFREKREFETLEKELEDLDRERRDIVSKMQEGGLPFAELETLSARFKEVEALIDAKESRWLELSEYET